MSATDRLRAGLASVLGQGSQVVGSVARRLGDVQRALRFGRGWLEFSVRPDDVFISSYPRSGTTWMQVIVHLLVRSSHTLEFDHISQVVPWFERSLAVGAVTADGLSRLPTPRVFKSHLPRIWLPDGARYVYVVRDGRDVAVSYYHFYRSHLRFDGSFDQFYRRFLAGDLQYGSWFRHVAGWNARRDDPDLLIVGYEELRRGFEPSLRRIARFLDVALDDERARQIATWCSFDAMRQNEHKFDFATEFLLQSGYSGGGFLRRGQVGQGRVELDGSQQRRFANRTRRRPLFPTLELDLPSFLH